MDNINTSYRLMYLQDKVQEICYPFLSAYDLSFFQIRRDYGGGRVNVLSTNTKASIGVLKKFLFHSFYERKNIEACGNIYMANDKLPFIVSSFIENKYKVYDPIVFVRTYEDYYETITYGLVEKHPQATTYYASILKALEIFSADFFDIGAPLLEIAEKNPVIIPCQSEPVCSAFLQNAQNIEVQGRFERMVLSVDEILFLHLLYQGKTKVEIAKILSLSIQQVDKKITGFEQKMGCPLFYLEPLVQKSSLFSLNHGKKAIQGGERLKNLKELTKIKR